MQSELLCWPALLQLQQNKEHQVPYFSYTLVVIRTVTVAWTALVSLQNMKTSLSKFIAQGDSPTKICNTVWAQKGDASLSLTFASSYSKNKHVYWSFLIETDSIQQSHSWQSNRFWSVKFPIFFLWNPKVHYIVNNRLQLAPYPESDKSNPAPFPCYFFKKQTQ